MAITPKQALELTEEDACKVGQLEAKLDDFIKQRFTSSGTSVCFNVPTGTNQKVLNELMRRYSSASWSVYYRCDQRDGNYLELTEKRREPCLGYYGR